VATAGAAGEAKKKSSEAVVGGTAELAVGWLPQLLPVPSRLSALLTMRPTRSGCL